jgi:hypothetical protein
MEKLNPKKPTKRLIMTLLQKVEKEYFKSSRRKFTASKG